MEVKLVSRAQDVLWAAENRFYPYRQRKAWTSKIYGRYSWFEASIHKKKGSASIAEVTCITTRKYYEAKFISFIKFSHINFNVFLTLRTQ